MVSGGAVVEEEGQKRLAAEQKEERWEERAFWAASLVKCAAVVAERGEALDRRK